MVTRLRMKMYDHMRNRDYMASSQRANFVGRARADQELLHPMLVVHGHNPWISGTQDEVAVEAVTISLVMNMIGFFRAS